MKDNNKGITKEDINQAIVELISIEVSDIWSDETCDDIQAKMILGKIEGIIDTGERLKRILENQD